MNPTFEVSGIAPDTATSNGFALDEVSVVGGALQARRRAFLWWPERSLRDGDLVGAKMQGVTASGRVKLTIDETKMDADDSVNRFAKPRTENHDEVRLYRLSYQRRGQQLPLCGADKPANDPSRFGLFVAGSWDDSGSFSSDGVTFSCLDGVIAKCVRWGYRPWKTSTPPGATTPMGLAGLHVSCVRAARADYCGNGQSHTKDHTKIKLFDRYGFVPKPTTASDFVPESAFNWNGASAISKLRWSSVGLPIVNGHWECTGSVPQCMPWTPPGQRCSKNPTAVSVFDRIRPDPCPGDICVDSRVSDFAVGADSAPVGGGDSTPAPGGGGGSAGGGRTRPPRPQRTM